MNFIDCEAKGLENDLLNRGPFVQKVVRDICETDTSKSSFVLGIDGVWGEGKSSTKNFIEESLEKKQEQTLFINFNPWQWSDEDRLVEHFFSEVISVLERSKGREGVGIAEKLVQYLDYLELGREGIGSLNASIKAFIYFIFGGSLSATFLYLGPVDRTYKLGVLFLICSFIGLFLFEKLMSVIVFALKFVKIGVDRPKQTLQELKLDIHNKLSQCPYKIIIAVDDIDRLNKEEIRTLFKVIKVNADFPNLIYLLLFDKKIVSKSLHEDGVFEGGVYLEKIISIFYPLPKLDNRKFIQSFLGENLDYLIDEFNLSEGRDKGREHDVYFNGLEHQFKTLRDVKRYIASLRSSLKTFIIDGKLEIDFVDLIAMEGIKLFRSNVFQMIFDNKGIFTSSSEGVSSQDEAKLAVENIFKESGENKVEIQNILGAVFPNAAWTWSNMHSKVPVDSYAQKRIADEDIFERYFANFIGIGDFSEAFFEKALELLKSPDDFLNFCKKLQKEDRAGDFLEKLLSYKDKISKDKGDVLKILNSLYNATEILDDSNIGFFHFSEKVHLDRLIHWYFKKQKFDFDKKELFSSLVKETEGFVDITVDLFDEYRRINEEKRGEDFYIFDSEDKEKVLELLLKKFSQVKNLKEFSNNRRLPRLISIWKEIDSENASKWFDEYLSSDVNFMDFLVRIEQESSVSQGNQNWSENYISQAWFDVFFENALEVIKRVESIKDSEKFTSKKYQRILPNLKKMGEEVRGRRR